MSSRRLLPLLLLLLAAAALNGCTYMTDRYNDLMDIGDFGITLSTKPQLAVYASGPFVQVGALGWGHVDGYFIGMGEGHLSFLGPHYEESIGLFVWGDEYISFYHTEAELKEMLEKDKAKYEEVTNHMQVGILGMPLGWAGVGTPGPTLKYFGSCPHYIHLGFIGLSGGPRYLQMGDFLLGWTTLDLCWDDGRKLGARAVEPDAGTPAAKPAEKPVVKK